MRAAVVLLLAVPALAAPAPWSPVFTPPELDFQALLLSRINSLSSKERTEFFRQQAALRAKLPDYDQIEKTFPSAGLSKRDETSILDARELDEMTARIRERTVELRNEEKRQRVRCDALTAPVAPNIKSLNYTTCLATTATREIGNPRTGLATESTNGWGGGNIPRPLRGLFYMEGNPLPSQAFSTATAFWNATVGVWEMPAWAPGTWASENTGLGKAEHELFRIGATTYRNRCATGGIDGEAYPGLVCRTDQYVSLIDLNASFGQYWAFQVDPNYAIRSTRIRFLKFPDGSVYRYNYNLWRIIDEFGQKTPYFESKYIANIGKFWGNDGQPFGTPGQQPFGHLGENVYTPLRQ